MTDKHTPTPRNGRHWVATSASVQGSAHAKRQEPCQDSSGYRIHTGRDQETATLMAAAADGAGSAPLGGTGAQIAVQGSLQAAAELIDRAEAEGSPIDLEAVAKHAMLQARDQVHNHALEQQLSPKDFATTLLVAIADGHRIATAQIGDGAIVSGTADGTYELLTKPDQSEYVNETTFITASDAIDKLQLAVTETSGPDIKIAIFTDGIQNLVLIRDQDKLSPHPPFFDAVFAWLANQSGDDSTQSNLAEFLESRRLRSRTSDDITLLLALQVEIQAQSLFESSSW